MRFTLWIFVGIPVLIIFYMLAVFAIKEIGKLFKNN